MRAFPILVLLPGMHGTDDLFGPFLQVLPREIQTKVISYPTDQVLSFKQLSKLIESQLVGFRDIVVIGESFSGALALAFAAAHSDQVRAVVLSAAFVRPPLFSWLRWLVHPVLMLLPMPSFAIRFLVAGKEVSKGFVDTIRRAIRKPLPIVLAHRAKEVLTADCTQSLRDCAVPIQYLSPTHDHMVPHGSLKTILKIRPDVHVSEIEGPHLILQAKPVEAWQAIAEFLDRTESPGRLELPAEVMFGASITS